MNRFTFSALRVGNRLTDADGTEYRIISVTKLGYSKLVSVLIQYWFEDPIEVTPDSCEQFNLVQQQR